MNRVFLNSIKSNGVDCEIFKIYRIDRPNGYKNFECICEHGTLCTMDTIEVDEIEVSPVEFYDYLVKNKGIIGNLLVYREGGTNIFIILKVLPIDLELLKIIEVSGFNGLVCSSCLSMNTTCVMLKDTLAVPLLTYLDDVCSTVNDINSITIRVGEIVKIVKVLDRGRFNTLRAKNRFIRRAYCI